MKIKKYFTISGNYIILDADDDAPMIKIEFFNEFGSLDHEDKLKVLRKVFRRKNIIDYIKGLFK